MIKEDKLFKNKNISFIRSMTKKLSKIEKVNENSDDLDDKPLEKIESNSSEQVN